MTKAKKEMENLEKKYSKNEQDSETLKLEVESLQKEVDSYKQQIEQVQQGLCLFVKWFIMIRCSLGPVCDLLLVSCAPD